MDKIDLNLAALPKWAKIAIPVCLNLVVIVVFFFVFASPMDKDIKRLKGEISKQREDIEKSQHMAMKLDELKVENEKLKLRLAELSEQLPNEKEVSALLEEVSDAAKDAGLKVISWKPSPRRIHPSKIVYEVPVSVNMTGSFHRLAYFFSSLTRMDRIVNISDINLANPKTEGTEATLKVTFTAVTFTAASEGGLQDTDKKPKSRKKKKK